MWGLRSDRQRLAQGRLLLTFLSGVLIGWAAVAWSAEKSLYVRSAQAELRAEPSFGAEVIGTLKRGLELEVAGEQGRWVQVRHQGGKGWLPRLLVSESRPAQEASASVLGGEEADVANPRRRSSTVTTAAAARGLAGEAEGRAGANLKGDFQALERMEGYQVNPYRMRRFKERIR